MRTTLGNMEVLENRIAYDLVKLELQNLTLDNIVGLVNGVAYDFVKLDLHQWPSK